MYEVELEYERPACPLCRDSGRRNDGGIDRHCSCPLGRAMASAHWDIKAFEDAGRE